jgi:hypothetical protein
MAARGKAGKGPAVYCHGGPLDGMGFTLEDWERRREAESAMLGRSEQTQRSLLYRAPRREGLPSRLRAKTMEALDGYDVRTWVPVHEGTPCGHRLPHGPHVPTGWTKGAWCPGLAWRP